MDVLMPQMGESVVEGTIVRWIKKLGDKVDRDEPLFEISTDKVDAEIPAPAAGVLSQILAKEGDTVPVNTVVAVIGTGVDAPAPRPVASPKSVEPATAGAVAPAANRDNSSRDRTSPLVRQLAKDHDVELSQVRGTGIGGRVTKDDVLAFVAGQGHQEQGGQDRREGLDGPDKRQHGPDDRVEKMSVMRKAIADRMIASQRTSAHVHTVFEVDFSRIARIREATKISYLSFIVKAAADALKAFPVLNASVDGDAVVFRSDINIGVAVAIESGLIVPVVKHVDALGLAAIGAAISDLAARARAKQLKPDDVAGGTFTVTNPGNFGALLGTPIINQPQVAILGVGSIENRPAVDGDKIVARMTAVLTLGFDHRIIDGAVADQFMAHIRRALETWDESRA